MTDPVKPAPLPSAETNGQLIVSLTIVCVLGVLGVGMLWAGWASDKWEVLAGGIGTIIGALGNALTAPTGIASVLRANNAKPPEGG